MNYFNINPEYPYIRKEFIQVASNVTRRGDEKKLYHKNLINKVLPKDITNILKKIGGATDLKTLFIGDIKLNDLIKVCKNSKFYSEENFNDEFYKIDFYMKIIYLELFEKIFIKNKYILANNNLSFFFDELNRFKDEKSDFFNK